MWPILKATETIFSCRYCACTVGSDTWLGHRPGFKYGDGRVICKQCHDSAIKTPESLASLWQFIIQKMQSYGLDVNWGAVPVRLEHQPHFGAGGVIGLAKSTTQQTLFNFSCASEIIILYGMPKLLALETLAHEAGHVFCHHHRITFNPSQAEEGFCNLVAFKVLQDLHQQEAIDKLMRNPCPIYGGHFRSELAAMNLHGWSQYLAKVRKNQR